MSMALDMASNETTTVPQRILDRQEADELALVRREHQIESAIRRRKQERDEVRDRFSIDLVPLINHEDYAALAAKHFDVGTRRSELVREHDESLTAIARGLAAFNKDKLEHQAQSIIDGAESDAFKGFEAMQARSTRLAEGVKAYVKAQGMLSSQMVDIRSERSIDAADIARPAHKAVVGVIADACATLLKALRDEVLIREIVTEAGFDDRLPVFQGIKDFGELESRAREYTR